MSILIFQGSTKKGVNSNHTKVGSVSAKKSSPKTLEDVDADIQKLVQEIMQVKAEVLKEQQQVNTLLKNFKALEAESQMLLEDTGKNNTKTKNGSILDSKKKLEEEQKKLSECTMKLIKRQEQLEQLIVKLGQTEEERKSLMNN